FLFLVLMSLLIFSTGIILFGSLFASHESQFLLTTPLPDDHIFAYKFQGAVAFSSWGFLLLGSPVLIAYGLVLPDGAPWYFYAVLPLFFLGFVLIPGSIGAILCLLVVNFVPRHRGQLLKLVVGTALLIACVWLYREFRFRSQNAGREWFE